MNIKNQLFAMRKRIKDDELIKMQKIINEEIERRQINDTNNTFKKVA